MDFTFLFHNELPQGVKSIYVNGKRMSRSEFLQYRENYFSKNEQKNTNWSRLCNDRRDTNFPNFIKIGSWFVL